MADKTVFVKVGADVSGAVAGLQKVKSSVDDLTKAQKASVAGLAKAEREAARETDKAARAAQKAARETARVEAKAQAERKEAFTGLSNKAAIAGGIIALGIGKAVSSFADFDQQMSEVSAALPDAGAQMESLRGLAVKLGSDTQFSATEAAQGITEMAKAGVSASDIYNGGLKGGLDLAAAGALSVADASEIAATAVNQFNLKGADVPHIADLYSAAAGKAQGSVQDIAGAMKYAGVQAGAMGISIEETTGVIGLFASKGIIGEQAGTSFRSMLLSLTSPSKIAQKAMGDLGINVYDASGKFVGMQGAAQILQEKLGPLDEATRNAALGQIFGNESMAAAITLYQAGGEGVKTWTDNVNVAGFASEQAAKKTDNLKGDIERLGGSIETAFITGGSSANGALRTLTQGLGGVVDVVAKIPAPLLLATTGLASLALVLPKGISVYKDFTGSLDTMGISMTKLTAKVPKLAGAIRGLGGVFAGLAIAATIGAVTNAFTDLAAVEFDPQQIKDGAVTLDDFNKKMAETADLGLPVATTLSDFGQVLEATFSPGNGQQIDSFFASLNSNLGFENTSDVEVARQRFEDLDKTLSALVAAGKGEAAAALFKQVTDAAAAQGVKIDDVKSKLPGYADAMANAGDEAATAGPKIGEMSQDVQDIEKKADDAKKALDDLRSTLEGFGSPLAKQRAAQRDYADAIRGAKDATKDYRDELVKQRLESQKIDPEKASKKAKAAAKDWADAQIAAGKALDITTEAGSKNQATLDGLRDATLKASSSTFDLTHNSKLAADQVAKGREAFINQAVAFGLSKTAAAGLADQMGLIPKEVETTIGLSGVETANTQLDKTTGKVTTLDKKTAKPLVQPRLNGVQIDVANVRLDKIARRNVKPAVSPQLNGAAAAAAEYRLDLLARNRTATITVTALTGAANARIANTRAAIQDIRGYATGGPIYGPGTSTSDTAGIYALSNNEHVLTAAEVAAAGGHGAIFALRKALLSGGVQYRASGGPAVASYRSAPPVVYGSSAGSAPSLSGLAIVGTLDTPFGPAEVRGVVQQELRDPNTARRVVKTGSDRLTRLGGRA